MRPTGSSARWGLTGCRSGSPSSASSPRSTRWPALAGGSAAPPEGAAAAAVATSTWTLNQAGGVLLPFLFAFHLARSADLGTHVAPVAALLLLLSAAAAWIARGEPGAASGGFIALGAAGGDLAVLLVWCARTRFDAALAWEAAAVAVGLTLAFHAFVEIDLARRRRRRSDGGFHGSGGRRRPGAQPPPRGPRPPLRRW